MRRILWLLLSLFLVRAQEGTGIDPHGTPLVRALGGGAMDPNGAGSAMDPNGRPNG